MATRRRQNALSVAEMGTHHNIQALHQSTRPVDKLFGKAKHLLALQPSTLKRQAGQMGD